MGPRSQLILARTIGRHAARVGRALEVHGYRVRAGRVRVEDADGGDSTRNRFIRLIQLRNLRDMSPLRGPQSILDRRMRGPFFREWHPVTPSAEALSSEKSALGRIILSPDEGEHSRLVFGAPSELSCQDMPTREAGIDPAIEGRSRDPSFPGYGGRMRALSHFLHRRAAVAAAISRFFGAHDPSMTSDSPPGISSLSAGLADPGHGA